MQIEILYRPAYSLGVIKLDPQEQVRTEGGAMVAMSPGVNIETGATGGLLKSLARSVLAGESFFQNTFQAPAEGGQVMVAPPLPGDMQLLELKGESLMVQSGSYIASAVDLQVDTKWGGAKTFFASEGLVLLRVAGTGNLLVSSYGAIHETNLAAGESLTVDTGHIVAFSDSVGFKVRKVGGLKSTFLSGEGLVVDLTGPGRVLLQTRSTDAFLAWLLPKVPRSSSGN
jgi:uncharacterized protein (TIGR00266 family)